MKRLLLKKSYLKRISTWKKTIKTIQKRATSKSLVKISLETNEKRLLEKNGGGLRRGGWGGEEEEGGGGKN